MLTLLLIFSILICITEVKFVSLYVGGNLWNRWSDLQSSFTDIYCATMFLSAMGYIFSRYGQ